MENYCVLSQEEIHERIGKYKLKDYNLGGIVTTMRIHDSIFAEGILWGEEVVFKLKSSIN